MISPRLAAVKTVLRILNDKAFSNIELNSFSGEMSASDKSLYFAIVKTVVERKITLEHIMNMFVKKKPDNTTKCLLYVGIAQIMFMDKIPDSAACDETVKASKELVDVHRSGFINGVLRNICRNRASVIESIESSSDEIKYSVNAGICNLLHKQYPSEYKTLLENSFGIVPLTLRVNTMVTDAEKLAESLNNSGIKCSFEGNTVTVHESADKAISQMGNEYFVQGRSSQYAVKLLNAESSMTVIDVCACPGGKTVGAAIDMKNQGVIYAFDIHGNKLSLIRKNASQMGITIINESVHDSRKAKEELIGTADRVICDVPCSALGLIASKPEIRYKDPSDFTGIYDTQYTILCESAKYLKAGGKLVYSTCTMNKMENTLQIHKFLDSHPEYKLIEEKQFLWNVDVTEGFYAALIERI